MQSQYTSVSIKQQAYFGVVQLYTALGVLQFHGTARCLPQEFGNACPEQIL